MMPLLLFPPRPPPPPPLCGRYINDYVLCSSCKSVDTLLDRDSSTRIMFLRCQQCSASRTVAGERLGAGGWVLGARLVASAAAGWWLVD